MSTLVNEQDATGKTKEIYDDIQKTFGMVPNFFKAQAAVDPNWLELNWQREKQIMVTEGALDRKTKELIALVVSMVNKCEYCSLAHEGMARMVGASKDEINEVKKVVELFCSFNSIADSLKVPCDLMPPTE
ncbi:MAG: carboxymuconolactone decarboxylase family protein [Desulfoarculaceae bacterium]|nr:carboxymuconolactone decarboxylase family protein [Desulfoarculaceae bacterium]